MGVRPPRDHRTASNANSLGREVVAGLCLGCRPWTLLYSPWTLDLLCSCCRSLCSLLCLLIIIIIILPIERKGLGAIGFVVTRGVALLLLLLRPVE